ncbi:carbamoyltransferase [Arenicella sp. 4NH20-0111]|uniref:carbamoyltransferase family protein n=1 Tax=Arenicella sp. 4NH20-0111 TaxID=3127648 RepID=UPI003106E014
MIILGISAFYHDSAAAIIDGERIIAAAQEERFTRIKHDSSFPENAVEYCLAQAGLNIDDVDSVVFFEKPFIKFERLLETYVSFVPRGFASFKSALPLWVKEKLFQKKIIREMAGRFSSNPEQIDWEQKLKFSEHHLSHAASAFYPSPFEEAVVLTLDGVGEWVTTSVAIGRGNKLEIVKEIHFPHSLGLLYSAFTYYTGFRVNSGEYKVMGLAPYGEPKYTQLILDNLIDVKEDGSYRLDQQYFNYCTGLTMTNKKFDALFGRPARKPDQEELEQFHMDIAASVQEVTEIIVLKLTKSLAAETGIRNLCMAGGVALNCVANGKIQRAGHFDNVWVQPAAGDAGGALGAAQAVAHMVHDLPRTVKPNDNMQGSYLGCEFSNNEIRQRLDAAGAVFEEYEQDGMLHEAAKALAEQQVVGWFQGRMEFGPRALGGRSILGDPRSEAMQKTLNLKIKYRESFRPFAPSILREHVSDWFELNGDSPYMLLVDKVKGEKCIPMNEEQKSLFGIEKLNIARSSIPAVTHVDYSARIQTVHNDTNPLYHGLISKFNDLSGCPVVVNTSFNVRGEPIVCSPEDAFNCFMGTEMDVLAIGDFILRKADQDSSLAKDYKHAFKLD